MKKIRVVHYINQFFGQIGGEEKASVPPFFKEGIVGPGALLQSLLGDRGEVVGTVICGDTYFGENPEKACEEVVKMIAEFKPDMVIAGPAFNAGRYGPACAQVCIAVKKQLGIVAVTGMNEENPGVELYKQQLIIAKSGASAATMKQDMTKVVELAMKLYNNEELKSPEEEGYFRQGIRKNIFSDKKGCERALAMVLARVKGEDFKSEITLPNFDMNPPAPPVKDIKKATIAFVTDGGIVPLGNPDHLKSSTGTEYGKYSIEGLESMTPDKFECIHAGLDKKQGCDDPNRFIPLNALKEIEHENKIGKVFNYFYTVAGCTVELRSAKNMGVKIAKDLKENNVDAVILTSG